MQSRIAYEVYPILLVVVLGAILLEVLIGRQSKKRVYSWRESLASLGVALGHRLSQSVFAFIPTGLVVFAWQHRMATVPLDRWWSIPLLFIGIEFFYYWHHRAAHEVRWLWATHAVHHSVQYFNLSAAYRLGWTGWLSGNILFFLPLCWLGSHPLALLAGLSLNLVYQFWLHSELVPKLGVLEWVLNTPSHHRVHHASNPQYLDRNYGGVLIVFDRLFGTVAEEQPTIPIRYGLTHPLHSHNPVTIALHEWYRLFQDLSTAKTWGDRWRIVFGSPT